ncbi:MAG: hypothetical protein AAF821_26285 [Cyanobacteria bacterium P01_D01_bin.156]
MQMPVLATLSGTDQVTGWIDQSGSNNSLSSTGNPILVNNAISFDKDGNKLERLADISLHSGNADRTMFLVANYNSVGEGGFTYGAPSEDKTFGLPGSQDGDLKFKAWGRSGDSESDFAGTGQGWLSQSVILSDGVINLYKDGVLLDKWHGCTFRTTDYTYTKTQNLLATICSVTLSKIFKEIRLKQRYRWLSISNNQ